MFEGLPEEWGEKPLRELADHISRGSAPSYAAEDTSIWAVSQKCVRDGGFDLDQCRSHNAAKPVREAAYLRAGDICINSTGTGTLGRVALWRHGVGRYFADTHVTVVRATPTKADPAFLAAFLGMPSTCETIYRECVTGSTNQIELSKTALGELVCPVPPLDEQRRIAEVLRSVDEAILASQAVVRQGETLWHGLTDALIWNLEAEKPNCVRALGEALRGSDYGVNVPLTIEANGHPVLRMGNIQDGRIDLSDLKWGEVPPQDAEVLALREGDILFNRTNSRDLVGKVALVREQSNCLYASYIVRLSVNRAVADPYYLFAALHSNRAQRAIKAIATPGVSQSNINPTNLKQQRIPLPDLETQRTIADQLRSVEDARLRSQQELEVLEIIKRDIAANLLSGRIRVPAIAAVGPAARMVQPAFKRAVLAAEIVHQLHKDAKFGSVKHEKIVHLCELHANLHEDLDRHAYKEAAGPYDPKARRSVEKVFRAQKWFEAAKNERRVEYLPLERCGSHRLYYERYFGDRHSHIQNIIDRMRPMTSEQCEIVATLYAVWNDFLLDGVTPTDHQIVQSVLNSWHPSKRRISEDRWLAALPWMRSNDLVPTGVGEKTRVVSS